MSYQFLPIGKDQKTIIHGIRKMLVEASSYMDGCIAYIFVHCCTPAPSV